jgi:uncharacterized membrane protein (DUF441 family)
LHEVLLPFLDIIKVRLIFLSRNIVLTIPVAILILLKMSFVYERIDFWSDTVTKEGVGLGSEISDLSNSNGNDAWE